MAEIPIPDNNILVQFNKETDKAYAEIAVYCPQDHFSLVCPQKERKYLKDLGFVIQFSGVRRLVSITHFNTQEDSYWEQLRSAIDTIINRDKQQPSATKEPMIWLS